MYGNNQFDGSAAFDGGGFMINEPTTQTPGQSSSSPATKEKQQALLPLTVKQINQGSSDEKSNLLIDGVAVNTVTLVGMVVNKTDRVSEVQFGLYDGTGRITCQRWVDESVETDEMERIRDGMYVRVHGHLKGIQGNKLLMVFSVRPLTEFDELTYHYVDCISAHNYNTKVRGSAPPPSIPNSAVNTPSKGYQAAFSNQYTETKHTMVGELVDVDLMVFNYLDQYITVEEGIHLNDIAKSLNLPMAKIKSSLDALVQNGAAYETIDEFHFKSARNG